MIKLIATGHLGRDAEIRDFNGNQVLSFTVASTYTKKGQMGYDKLTQWIDCSYWINPQSRLIDYLKKGQQVLVEGSIEVQAYTNRDGQAAAALRMRVAQIELLGKNESNAAMSSGPSALQSSYPSSPPAAAPVPQNSYVSPAVTAPQPASGSNDDVSDDLPF